MMFDSTAQGALEGAIRESAFDPAPAESAPERVVRALAEVDVDAVVEIVDDLDEDLQRSVFLKEDVPTARQQELDAMSLDDLERLLDDDADKSWEVMHGPAPKPATAPSKTLEEMSLSELDAFLDGTTE